MKQYGNPRLKTASVKSNDFASDKSFNKLVVHDLSEVDQTTLDHDVIIFNKKNDRVYTYSYEHDSWIDILERGKLDMIHDLQNFPEIFIDTSTDVYNEINLVGNESNFLSVDSELFNFGEIGSPIDFVIDFWLSTGPNSHDDIWYGTILYNGQNTGQVDLEQNKNLLITTADILLLKDPTYQRDPIRDYSQYSGRDNYIYIPRPGLYSARPLPLIDGIITHVALIRSGPTTYLAIDGKIEDSAPSVEYFHYDDVLIGTGYVDSITGKVINLRVTKGTDLGWTTDFTPPNYNPTPDVNTDFLMDSTSNVLVDNAGNYDINIQGTSPVITQNRFQYQLSKNDINKVIKTNLNQNKLTLKLPDIDIEYSVIIDCDIPVEIHTYREQLINNLSNTYNRKNIIDFDAGESGLFTVFNSSIILHTNNFRILNRNLLYRYFYYHLLKNGMGSIHYFWIDFADAVYDISNNVRNYDGANFPLDGPPLISGALGSTDFSNKTSFVEFAPIIRMSNQNVMCDCIFQLHDAPIELLKFFGQDLTTNANGAFSLLIDTDLKLKGRAYCYPEYRTSANPIFDLFDLELGITYHLIIAKSNVSGKLYIMLKNIDTNKYHSLDFTMGGSGYDYIHHRIWPGPWYISHIRSNYNFDNSLTYETDNDPFTIFRHSSEFNEHDYINNYIVLNPEPYDRLYFRKSYEGSKFTNLNFILNGQHVGVSDFLNHNPYNRTSQLIKKQGPSNNITHVFDMDSYAWGTYLHLMDVYQFYVRNYSWAFDFWFQRTNYNNTTNRYIVGYPGNYQSCYYDSQENVKFHNYHRDHIIVTPVIGEWYHIIVAKDSNSTLSTFVRHVDETNYTVVTFTDGAHTYDHCRTTLIGGPWYLSNYRFWMKPGSMIDSTFDFMKFSKGVDQNQMFSKTIGSDNETIW